MYMIKKIVYESMKVIALFLMYLILIKFLINLLLS